LTSDFLIILPGGAGTESEAELCTIYKPEFKFQRLETDGVDVLDDLLKKIKHAVEK
jgi:predicted Rossmann-fold nucleotide-binding protein